MECDVPESLLNELGSQQYSASLNRMLSQGMMNFETVQQLATPDLVSRPAGGVCGAVRGLGSSWPRQSW